MKLLKQELISNWRKTVETEDCEIHTCVYIKNPEGRMCGICPLNYNFKNSLLCLSYKYLQLTKSQWEVIFSMLEKIPKECYTKNKFKRSEFNKVYNKLMEFFELRQDLIDIQKKIIER